MKCDNCGRDVADNQATPVTRSMPTGQTTIPVEVVLCPRCKNGRTLAVKTGLVVVALCLLALGLIVLYGYLIT